MVAAGSNGPRPRQSRSDSLFGLVNALLLALVVLAVLYPLAFVVSASFSDPDAVSRGELLLLPKLPSLDGYRYILSETQLWIGYRNTVFYTVLGTAINLAVTIPCAYVLSRKDFYLRNFLTVAFTFTMFFSGGMIPLFLVVQNLGLLDSVWAMVLPNAAAMWNIIVSRTYLQSAIPDELQDAAMIDGCTNMRMFVSIVLPLSKPIVAVMALFYGVQHWNAFFNALIFLSNRQLYPLQMVLREILLRSQATELMMAGAGGEMEEALRLLKVSEAMKYAIIVVSTFPLLIAYPFVQKYFVKGVLIGSLKG